LAVATLANGADVDLDSTNFQSTIAGNDYVLVMFYAPWCGHCKTLKPKFSEAADKAEGKYVLAKVDCTLENAKDLCQEYGVRGYPTVKFFKKGAPQDYTGPRETDGIISWLDKKTGPSVVTLKNEAEVSSFLASNKAGLAVVGYFDAAGSDDQKKFVAAADDADVEEFKFAQAFGVSGRKDGEVELFAQGVEHDFPATTDMKGLAKWLFESSFALVDEVGGHNFAKYAKRGKPLHLVFVDPADASKDQLLEDLKTVASEHADEAFSWIDAQKYKAQIKGMGASGNVVPCIIRLSSFGSDNKPVVFEKPLTLDSLRDWAVGVKTGKYVYVPKSEEVPVPNDGPVKIVVGKNFNEIVNDPSKDVLVEYYAPWCGHCKTLAPKYETLGTTLKNVDGVTIAKIDATANDVDSKAEVKGFPTILLYKANDKDHPVVYSGEREVAAMIEFVKQHASGKWEL